MGKMKSRSARKMIVVGDRVLVQPEETKLKTNHGLYLPQGIESKEKVQGGYVVKTGPGYLIPDPGGLSDEPWGDKRHEPKYLPLQVEEGDYVLFLRKAAIDIDFEGEKYVLLPYSSILLIVREDLLDSIAPGNDAEQDGE